MTAEYAAVTTAVGAALLIAGVAVIYWPAALIAAGALLVTVGLVTENRAA